MNLNKLVKRGTFPRSYRQKTFAYSLNPAIALAMNQMAGLDENDRILDPFCGTGTILIERQLLKPCLCVGLDIDPRAIEAAKQNSEAASVEIELKHGDIKEKKFPHNYFTKIISNLPYGIHSGSREKNLELYKFLADQAINWLKPAGQAVFLTNAKSLLRNTFAHNPNWQLISENQVNNSGLHLSIFVYQKL